MHAPRIWSRVLSVSAGKQRGSKHVDTPMPLSIFNSTGQFVAYDDMINTKDPDIQGPGPGRTGAGIDLCLGL